MREIDWTEEPFAEILAEFKSSFEAELAYRLKKNKDVPNYHKGFVQTESMAHFTTLSEDQERMFQGINLYVGLEEMREK